jgi:DNA-directed RNA polymerase subunit RPC12/RpoP
MQKCANCERVIGNLEKVYDFNGQSVCSECNQRVVLPVKQQRS